MLGVSLPVLAEGYEITLYGAKTFLRSGLIK